jgi:hypothetical protein
VFVLSIQLYPVTDNPESCANFTVIRFLGAKNISAMEIHRELQAHLLPTHE